MILDSIVCREIGEESYILGNTAYRCDDFEAYKLYLMYPLIILILIVFPFFMAISMKNMGKRLKKQ